ncbi:MAG: aminoacyl-tRNA hydrolase [bacterium]
MKLIVGLGNPGKEYIGTRHNFGFATVDNLADKYDGDFKLEKKFKAEICEIIVSGEKIKLLKPQTFMNLSGEAIQSVMSYFNINTEHLWVAYDDIDLELGVVRVRQGGSSAGHKGVKSIIECIGTDEFARFRMGIKTKECDNIPTEAFVLQKFTKDEEALAQEVVTKTVSEIEKALAEGIEHISI